MTTRTPSGRPAPAPARATRAAPSITRHWLAITAAAVFASPGASVLTVGERLSSPAFVLPAPSVAIVGHSDTNTSRSRNHPSKRCFDSSRLTFSMSRIAPSLTNNGSNGSCIHANVLSATVDDNVLDMDVIERLELNQQFERWIFLQKLLEGELPPSDVEDVLLLSLHSYLLHGPTATSSNNKDENGGNASPVLTAEQRAAMGDLLDAVVSASDGIGESRFLHMLVMPPVDYASIRIDAEEPQEDDLVEVDPVAYSILEQIEGLLPDPVEEEESHKSTWDVVIDLHGRESVRVREEALLMEKENSAAAVDHVRSFVLCAESLQWRTVCAVGRILIHYDFLTKGVLEEGVFR